MSNLITNGSVIAVIGVFIVDYIFKPIVVAIIEMIKEKNKNKFQSELEMENKIKSSELEFDKYKKDKVLPVLQRITNILEDDVNTIQKYSNYLTDDYKLMLKENKTAIDEYDMTVLDKEHKEIIAQREENVGKLNKEISEISIYLPKEIRDILLVFRISMECALFNSENLSYVISLEMELRIDEIDSFNIGRFNIKIYRNLLNCFYKLVEGYIKIDYKEKDYLKILKEYGLNNQGEYEIQSNDYRERISAVLILGVTRRRKEEQDQLLELIKEPNEN